MAAVAPPLAFLQRGDLDPGMVQPVAVRRGQQQPRTLRRLEEDAVQVVAGLLPADRRRHPREALGERLAVDQDLDRLALRLLQPRELFGRQHGETRPLQAVADQEPRRRRREPDLAALGRRTDHGLQELRVDRHPHPGTPVVAPHRALGADPDVHVGPVD